jgi:hypothetical protein
MDTVRTVRNSLCSIEMGSDAETPSVVYTSCSLGTLINAAGWSIWSTATPNTSNVLFAEFASTGKWQFPLSITMGSSIASQGLVLLEREHRSPRN